MSQWIKLWFMSGVLFCASCATQVESNITQTPSTSVFRDDLFPSYMLSPVEDSHTIFALSSEAQAFVDRTQSDIRTPRENIRNLVNQIFDHAALGLSYQSAANTNAATTFERGQANCLSLSVMTYAMAKYAGLSPQFYQVNIPEYWTRREGVNLLNGHINLRISPHKNPNDIVFSEAFADVDFDPQEARNDFTREPISRKRVIAMFYNNKGADALLADSYSTAYRYFKAAVNTDSTLSQAWVNLGVLYRRLDENDSALASYQRALEVNPNHLTAWENLSILYAATGRENEAQKIQNRLARERQQNPFYHTMLGEDALAAGKPTQALSHFRAALRLDRRQHVIYFGLAKAYVALGEDAKARTQLVKAARLVPDENLKARYQSKLSALQSS